MLKSLDHLNAEADIRTLQLRYCRAADRLDMEAMRACFHEDAIFAFPVYSGEIEGFLQMARETLGMFVTTRHVTGNQLVGVSGYQGWAEHYTVATHRMAADEAGPARDYVAHVRYIDLLERREDWRISHRTLLTDLSRTDALSDLPPRSRESDGRRDTSDPSYALYTRFKDKPQ